MLLPTFNTSALCFYAFSGILAATLFVVKNGIILIFKKILNFRKITDAINPHIHQFDEDSVQLANKHCYYTFTFTFNLEVPNSITITSKLQNFTT
jgi:hypothetical protein